MLLSPTSPARLPEDVSDAVRIIEEDCDAVGVVAASKPRFNPRWVCIDMNPEGYARQSFPSGKVFQRRQEVPPILRINGLLYLWRRDHVANSESPQYYDLPHRVLEVSEERAIDIDNLADFRLAEVMIRDGLIQLPWLDQVLEQNVTSIPPTSSE